MGQLPSVALVLSFIDAINHGDVDRLVSLMTDDHRLEVLDEEPLVEKEANRVAWRRYVERFPDYVICPREIAELGNCVAVLGHTTGSHLGLPDAEESLLTVIWIAEIEDGLVRDWRIAADTPDRRRQWGLPPDLSCPRVVVQYPLWPS